MAPNLTEDVTEESNTVPIHHFTQFEKPYESGKKKGQSRTITQLDMGPYKFTKRSVQKNIMYFSCNGCRSDGKITLASANMDDNIENFELRSWPVEHVCVPTRTAHLVREFREKVYKGIFLEPIKSISLIYNEVEIAMTENMSKSDKDDFTSDRPTLRQMISGLTRYRHKFVPRPPTSAVSIKLHF